MFAPDSNGYFIDLFAGALVVFDKMRCLITAVYIILFAGAAWAGDGKIVILYLEDQPQNVVEAASADLSKHGVSVIVHRGTKPTLSSTFVALKRFEQENIHGMEAGLVVAQDIDQDDKTAHFHIDVEGQTIVTYIMENRAGFDPALLIAEIETGVTRIFGSR